MYLMVSSCKIIRRLCLSPLFPHFFLCHHRRRHFL
jgi:hypothetical protein